MDALLSFFKLCTNICTLLSHMILHKNIYYFYVFMYFILSKQIILLLSGVGMDDQVSGQQGRLTEPSSRVGSRAQGWCRHEGQGHI